LGTIEAEIPWQPVVFTGKGKSSGEFRSAAVIEKETRKGNDEHPANRAVERATFPVADHPVTPAIASPKVM